MNFNTMDLIYVKECFYDLDTKEHKIITNFIDVLVDIQFSNADNYKKFKEYMEAKVPTYFKSFVHKQEMIELAYKINKLEFHFLKDMKVKVREDKNEF